jgi:CRISPR/Cas system-associated exonuclease Cas4 (RecB family)
MEIISQMCNTIKLYYRYGCRRLGLPSYQVHQIYLPKQEVIYIPIKKNASTSVEQALHEIEYGCLFNTDLPEYGGYDGIHEYYQLRPHAFTSVNVLKKQTKLTRFAIIREPINRLISCYHNRVVDEGRLAKNRKALQRINLPAEPDLNTFVINLKKYRKMNKNIEHHSRPQSDFLGGTIQYLDYIYTMKKIPELFAFLRKYKPDLVMRKRRSSDMEISMDDLSQQALEKAIHFYRKDYQLLHDYFSPPNF